MLGEVVDAQGHRMIDEESEHAAPGRQIADVLGRGRVHTHMDELPNPTIGANDTECAVPSIGQIDRSLDDATQGRLQFETGRDGDHRLEESLVALGRHGTHTDSVRGLPLIPTGAHGALRVLGAAALAFTMALSAAPPASAHQPVRLTSSDRTPSRGPLLVDGTVSFAVYASVRKGTTRGFRFDLESGDRLAVQLLIPDQAPANRLRPSQLPRVTIIDPQGRRTTMDIDERTPFYEPYSGTSYLYLSRVNERAKDGRYRVIVTGRSTTKVPVVIGVGYREVPGQVRG